MWTNYIYQLGC